jgi:hypothetical protein
MSTVQNTKIVTDGLVLCLDAANTKSYVSGSTIWNDISRSGFSGSLLNGPTFISNNGGSILFDGVDDYTDLNYDLSWNNTNSVTISLYVKPSSLLSYRPFIGKGPTNWEWEIIQETTSLTFVYWNTGGGHTNGPITTISNFFTNTTNFVNIVLVWNHIDNKYYFYRNSILISTVNWVDASINQNRTDGIKIGGNIYQWSTAGRYWNGNISGVLVYNRALSSSEVLQNYNAQKSRFGLS